MDALAVYGAAVGSVAISWQVYTWRRDRQTKVVVEVAFAMMAFGPNVADAVLITVINRSRHPIRTNAAGLELQDGSHNWSVKPQVPNGATIPGVINAQDSGTTWWFFEEAEQAGFDLAKPLVARVNLSTGERFMSKPAIVKPK